MPTPVAPVTVVVGLLLAGAALLRAVVPAALWNARGAGAKSRLVWRFPDALSPAATGHGTDPRPLAFAFREVAFRLQQPRESQP